MTIQISLIGLGQIGTSLGLALKGHKDLVRRVGNDREGSIARQAEKLGALDQVIFNLPSAVRQADLVILDSPVDDLREILQLIGNELKDGAVVIDTGPVKTPVFQWAAEFIKPGRDFIAWNPAINPAYLHEITVGTASAHADLFQNGLIYISAPAGTSAPGIKLASDLANLVGAKAMFGDPVEMDGLAATYHMLPQLMAFALLSSTVDQPGWQEGRKLAGRTYTEATAPIEFVDETKNFGQAILLNRENVVRVLDNFVQELYNLRNTIADNDTVALRTTIEKSLVGRRNWQNDRQKGAWMYEGMDTGRLPTSGDVLSRLVGFGGRKDKTKDDHK
jgi:prephenate dehydrogenase